MVRRVLFSYVIGFLCLVLSVSLWGCGSGGGGANLNQSASNSGNPGATPNPHIAVSDTGIRYLYGVSKTKKDGNVFFYLRTARTYQEAVSLGQPQPDITIYMWGDYRTHVVTDTEGKFSLQDFARKPLTRAAFVRFAAFNKDGVPLGSFEDLLAYFGPGNPETLQSIVIVPSELNLNVGDACTFFCYGYDEDNYPLWIFYPQWSSSNNSAGVIDSMFGSFSALASGTTTITATFQALTDTATVTVQGSGSASGSISGTVVIVNTTTPIPDALVMVMPANPWAFFLGGTIYSDANGEFTINDIPNGDYYAYAFAFYDDAPYMSNMNPQPFSVNGSTNHDITCASSQAPLPPSGPIITTLTPNHGETEITITLTGSYFGATQGSNTVTFYDSQEATVTLWSDTEIICEVPEDAETGPVIVQVNEQDSNDNIIYTLGDLPDLDSLTPDNGLIGATVTLAGSGFGATQGSSSVNFNGTSATVSSWGDTQIVCTVPEGATTGLVKVKLAGWTDSNGITFVVIQAPVIQSLSQFQGWPGLKVTISGQHFGAVQGSGTVKFNTTEVEDYLSWNDSRIVVRIPTGISGLNPAVEVTANNLDSNTDMTIAIVAPPLPPSLDTLYPDSGPVGTPVTISGNNLGLYQIDDSNVFFNETDAGTVTSWSATRIVCSVPEGATTGPVTIRVKGQYSNDEVTFTVTTPEPQLYIDNLSPESGTEGTAVTITGTEFGATQGESTVVFYGIEADITSWSDTQIICTVPEGAGTGLVFVIIDEQYSNGAYFTVLPFGPYIDSLDPTSGYPDDTVTIAGEYFGTFQGDSTVCFNGTEATATDWSDTQIICTVPAEATTGPVVITVEGQDSNEVNFTILVQAPGIDELTPDHGTPGSMVTITGSYFGTTQGESTVAFYDSQEATVTLWSDTQIICQVPEDAETGDVVVTVGSQASDGVLFTVDTEPTPVIDLLSPNIGIAGDLISIEGDHFGSTGTVTFNGTTATPTAWNNTHIVCPVPANATTGNVVVTVNSQASDGENFYVITGSNYATVEGQVRHYDTQANLSGVKVEFEILSGGTVGEKYRVMTGNTAGGFNYQIHIPASPAVMCLSFGKDNFYKDVWTTGYLNSAQTKIINTDMVPNDIQHIPPYPHNSWGP